MIGGYTPQGWRWQEPVASDLLFENFRQELRRGCLALAVLAQLRVGQCGYELRRALAGRGIGIELGTLYPLLRRLEAQGLLFSEWREEGKRRKRFYRLTTGGRRILEQLFAEWKRIDRSLSGIAAGLRDEAA